MSESEAVKQANLIIGMRLRDLSSDFNVILTTLAKQIEEKDAEIAKLREELEASKKS